MIILTREAFQVDDCNKVDHKLITNWTQKLIVITLSVITLSMYIKLWDLHFTYIKFASMF
jgi:hypothetical protein